MTDAWKDTLDAFSAMTEAVRRDARERALIRALAQRAEPPALPAPVDPGEQLRAAMKEQRDAIAKQLGVTK